MAEKKKSDTSRFSDIEGSVITKKDGSKLEFRGNKMVCIKPAKKK